jgi:nitrogen regulatory protein PII
VKKIEAIIPPSQLDAVRAEFSRRGISGQLTLADVRHGEIHKSSINDDGGNASWLFSRVKMELIVANHQVDKAISVILRLAVTDPSAGAVNEEYGYLMLLPIDEFQRIVPSERESP